MLASVWWTAVAAMQWVVSGIRIRIGRGALPLKLVLLRLAMRGPSAAIRLARCDSIPASRLSTLGVVSQTLHDEGRHADAVRVARHAERLARSLRRFDADTYPARLTQVAGIWAHIDEPEHAERLVRLGADPEMVGLALVNTLPTSGPEHDHPGDAVRALGLAGRPDVAERLVRIAQGRIAREAAEAAIGRNDPFRKASFRQIVQALTEVGLHDHAVTVCRASTDAGFRAELVSVVVRALGSSGQQEQARRLADDALAQAVARTSRRVGLTTVTGLAALARARAAIGDDAGAAACLRAALQSLDRGSETDRLDAYVALAWAAHELGRPYLATAAYVAARLTDRFTPYRSRLGLVLAVSPFVAKAAALVALALHR